MKLLLVFVSALVLVALGNATGVPSKEFAEEAPGVHMFGAEEESITERDPAFETGVYIASVARACTNAACANVCHRLGFRYGQCTSPSTCWCHN